MYRPPPGQPSRSTLLLAIVVCAVIVMGLSLLIIAPAIHAF